MTESFAHLLVDVDGPVAVVTVHRPAALNALHAATIAELQMAFEALGANPSIRAIVLTGSGPKAFVAGADIKEMSVLDPLGMDAYARAGQRLCATIETLGTPVIAAVNGFALGGGNELAMACTLRIAADTARFGQPEIKLGLMPGFGGTQRLARLVGQGRALHMLLTGEPIDAQEAWRIGLVNRVVPAAEVLAAARATAAAIAALAPVAARLIIEAVVRGGGMPLADAVRLESALFGLVASTDDMREGTRAFVEKRPAEFKGH